MQRESVEVVVCSGLPAMSRDHVTTCEDLINDQFDQFAT